VTRRATGRVDDAFGELAQKIAYAQVLRRARHQFVQPGAIAPPRRKVRGYVLSRSVRVRGRRLRRLSRAAARRRLPLLRGSQFRIQHPRVRRRLFQRLFQSLPHLDRFASRLGLARRELATEFAHPRLQRHPLRARRRRALRRLHLRARQLPRPRLTSPPFLSQRFTKASNLFSRRLFRLLSRAFTFRARRRRRRKSSWKFPPKLHFKNIAHPERRRAGRRRRRRVRDRAGATMDVFFTPRALRRIEPIAVDGRARRAMIAMTRRRRRIHRLHRCARRAPRRARRHRRRHRRRAVASSRVHGGHRATPLASASEGFGWAFHSFIHSCMRASVETDGCPHTRARARAPWSARLHPTTTLFSRRHVARGCA